MGRWHLFIAWEARTLEGAHQDNIFGGTWHGMFVGIEADGYRHS